MQSFDVVIIGAGAAGMMCAIHAAKRKRKVVLLDHSKKIGRKIFISGGGRCNFTNLNTGPDNYVSQNPHFSKSALARYTPFDFISLLNKHKIPFHEKTLGQLFCDQSAQQIVEMLVAECNTAGVEFRLGCQINEVKKDKQFCIETNHGQYNCQSLVVATGGLSVPQTGATDFGYKIANQFGLKIIDPKPALDGFNLQRQQINEFTDLAGVSLNVIVTCNKKSFRENILFTHNGLSGPASLQASLYWNIGDSLIIDLLPEFDIEQWLTNKKNQGVKVQLNNALAELLPKRFADKFCELFLSKISIAQLSSKDLDVIANKIHNWQIVPASTVGFRKAEVTRGGVDTNELSSTSMESKKVSGLYFIGEVVDVTGWLGGYNFQWAWSSGFAAAEYV